MSDPDALAWWGGFTAGFLTSAVVGALICGLVLLFLHLTDRRTERRRATTEQQAPALPEIERATDWALPALTHTAASTWAPTAPTAATAATGPEDEPRHLAPDAGTPPERTHAFPRYRLRDRPDTAAATT